VAQLERHRKLQPVDAVHDLHGAYVSGACAGLGG
jgi:hypothetical protein